MGEESQGRAGLFCMSCAPLVLLPVKWRLSDSEGGNMLDSDWWSHDQVAPSAAQPLLRLGEG